MVTAREKFTLGQIVRYADVYLNQTYHVAGRRRAQRHAARLVVVGFGREGRTVWVSHVGSSGKSRQSYYMDYLTPVENTPERQEVDRGPDVVRG